MFFFFFSGTRLNLTDLGLNLQTYSSEELIEVFYKHILSQIQADFMHMLFFY